MKENKTSYALFKYMWLLVVIPKIACSLIILIYGIYLLYKTKKICVDRFLKVTITFYGIYFFSVLYRLFVSGSFQSVGATVNTLLMWLIGMIIYSYYIQQELDLKMIYKYCFINLNILIFLAVLFLLRNQLHFVQNISMFGNKLFSEPSWTNKGLKYRLFAFMEYPTNVATFYCINIGGAINYIFLKYTSALKRISYALLAILPVYLSDTRSGIIASIFVFGMVIFFSIDKRKYRKMFILLTILILIPLVVFAHHDIQSIFTSMIQSREGSSGTRLRLYSTTLEKVLSESPIIGMGIKYPNPAVFNLPYGSHSTYIGIFYRTGFLGLATLLINFIYLIRISLQTMIYDEQRRFLGVAMLGYFIAIIFLDIDATMWVLAVFIANCAFLSNPKAKRILE